jgi:predicted nuclease of restriction endonuclease-like (RecB) superfamily
MIETAQREVAVAANASLTTLYWQVGKHVRTEALEGRRAEYGGRIVAALGIKLQSRYGRSFGEKSLRHMIRFAEVFPDPAIVSALRRQLSWTHLKQLIYVSDHLKRDFVSPALVFQDPYMLDFLQLADSFSEKDLESAILRDLERFLLEIGSGFAFVERQKRITLDNDDYYIDLLFFHRRMRRLVAIELKIGDFKPADSGQMELYLRWLDKHERQTSEESPLGIILCAGKKRETVEYLDLDARGIHVAEYLTELPARELLGDRLRRAIEIARNRLALRSVGRPIVSGRPRPAKRR